MKSRRIERIEILDGRLREGWNPAFVRITAADGVQGTGELAPSYSPAIQAGLAHLRTHAPKLLGRDPFQIRMITAELMGGAFGESCLAVGHAASAVDIALHDLKARALGEPVVSLLGGRVRDSIRVYANGWCYNLETPEQYADAAEKVANDGYTAMKFDPFRYYQGGFDWAFQKPTAAPRARWMGIARDRVAAVREAIGPDVELILECHGKFDPPSAELVARQFAEFDLLWIEEPAASANAEVIKKVSDALPLAVGRGERLVGRQAFRPLLENKACSIIQPDLGMAGGLTEGKAVAESAEMHGILFAPHNAGGPVCTAASVQLDFAVPNFFIQEMFPYREEEYVGFTGQMVERRIKNGFLHYAEEAPGLGVELKDSMFDSAKIEVIE